MKIALSEKIALLLHRHVDVPCSLVVTTPQSIADNRLLLNEDKMEAILFRSSCPVTSTINIGGSVAQLKPTVRDIGVVLDTRLDMASQVSNVCRSAYYHLFRIAKIRASLTIVACKTLVHALLISRIDYGNALTIWHH